MMEKRYTLNDGRTIAIRTVENGDIRGLKALYQRLYRDDAEPWTQLLTPSEIDNRFESPNGFIGLVTKHNEEVVAYTEIEVDQSKSGYLRIHVHPEFQGVGLGTAMMIALLNEAKTRGIQRIRLKVSETNTRALRFFQKFGFQTTKREQGAIEMIKR